MQRNKKTIQATKPPTHPNLECKIAHLAEHLCFYPGSNRTTSKKVCTIFSLSGWHLPETMKRGKRRPEGKRAWRPTIDSHDIVSPEMGQSATQIDCEMEVIWAPQFRIHMDTPCHHHTHPYTPPHITTSTWRVWTLLLHSTFEEESQP